MGPRSGPLDNPIKINYPICLYSFLSKGKKENPFEKMEFGFAIREKIVFIG